MMAFRASLSADRPRGSFLRGAADQDRPFEVASLRPAFVEFPFACALRSLLEKGIWTMRRDTARSVAYEHDVNKQTFGASNKP